MFVCVVSPHAVLVPVRCRGHVGSSASNGVHITTCTPLISLTFDVHSLLKPWRCADGIARSASTTPGPRTVQHHGPLTTGPSTSMPTCVPPCWGAQSRRLQVRSGARPAPKANQDGLQDRYAGAVAPHGHGEPGLLSETAGPRLPAAQVALAAWLCGGRSDPRETARLRKEARAQEALEAQATLESTIPTLTRKGLTADLTSPTRSKKKAPKPAPQLGLKRRSLGSTEALEGAFVVRSSVGDSNSGAF